MTTVIYANTLAKYCEGKLLSEEKLARLADADFDAAVRILLDYGYGDGRAAGGYDVDALIRGEIAGLIDFVSEECFDESLAAVLLSPFLYNNAKSRYKRKLGSRFADENCLYPMKNDCTEHIELGEYDYLPEPMSAALRELDKEFAFSGANAARIDLVLSKAMFADMSARAKKAGKSVKLYVAAKIDLANIISALRLLRRKKETEEMQETLVSGGNVPFEKIIDAYSLGIEGFASAFIDTEYYEAVKKACDKGFDGLIELESESGRLEAEFFDSDTENMVSSAPFLHYFATAMTEIATVRTILTLIKNNGLELKTVLSHRVGAGDRTWVPSGRRS